MHVGTPLGGGCGRGGGGTGELRALVAYLKS